MAIAAGTRSTDPRKQRARANRRRMVEAAYRLFSERGYSVPLTAIAAEAGVAVQTVYFTFHTKAALLQETLQLAVLGDDQPLAPHERPWFGRYAAEPDQRKALQVLVASTQPIFERVSPLVGIFQTGDPEVTAMWDHSEELRAEGFRQMVAVLAKKGPLKPGLSLDEATDVLFVLLGPELFHSIVAGRGWSVARWRRWISATLAATLLPLRAGG